MGSDKLTVSENETCGNLALFGKSVGKYKKGITCFTFLLRKNYEQGQREWELGDRKLTKTGLESSS